MSKKYTVTLEVTCSDDDGDFDWLYSTIWEESDHTVEVDSIVVEKQTINTSQLDEMDVGTSLVGTSDYFWPSQKVTIIKTSDEPPCWEDEDADSNWIVISDSENLWNGQRVLVSTFNEFDWELK